MGPIKLFAIWAFSFLPGWLFIRFLGQRALGPCGGNSSSTSTASASTSHSIFLSLPMIQGITASGSMPGENTLLMSAPSTRRSSMPTMGSRCPG